MNLENKKVMVAGSGKSGLGAVSLLQKVGAKVTLYDGNDKLTKEAILDKLEDKNVEIIIGALTKEQADSFELMVLSPGIPVDAEFATLFDSSKVIGEIELAYMFSKGEVIAITGTNGKTTTTTLVGEIMAAYFEKTYVVGNIGNPYTLTALESDEKTVTVAEISSFQLETIKTFAPKVSAILNITPDHLNRHKTMENYIKVKEDVTMNQGKEDVCVLNYDQDILREFGEQLDTKVVYFSRLVRLENGVYYDGESIIYNDNKEEVKVCLASELNIIGSHNIENVMAAVAIAVNMGVPMDVIRDTVINFRAVEHRIEFVKEVNGVVYYNDSKGTNPDASIKAIEAMTRPTILIGGGYDKNSSYEEWIKSFGNKIKYLVLIGETKTKISKTALKLGYTNMIFANTLEEAVNVCADKASEGDAVLLSPACASWDMFKSYEERGRLFKEYVRNL